MKITIDRIEGEFAVCELQNGSFVNIPLCVFGNAKEGDVFNIERDDAERDARMQNAQSLFNKLKKK